MIVVMGIVGLFCGFAFGQMVLYFLLRHVPTKKLLEDKSLKMQYGLVCWGLAGLGAYVFVTLYETYF